MIGSEMFAWILTHAQENGYGVVVGDSFEPFPGKENDAIRFIDWWIRFTEWMFAKVDAAGYGIANGMQLDVMPGQEQAAQDLIDDLVGRVVTAVQLVGQLEAER